MKRKLIFVIKDDFIVHGLSLHFILLQNLSLIMQHNSREACQHPTVLKALKRNKPKNCADKKIILIRNNESAFCLCL